MDEPNDQTQSAELTGEPTGTPEKAITRVPQPSAGSGESSGTRATSGLLGQLQHLIDQVLSAPVTREFAAKAAELAALAAEKAGPAARSIADRTEDVGQSVAARATTFASSMRSEGDAAPDPAATDSQDSSTGSG